MTDYRLDGLSTRSFEHLIQALSLSAVTTTVTPFGDGPDGGREATFDGATDYGAESNRWRGYGVIQAKFLQRSRGTSLDGRWALKELRNELTRYRRRKVGRQIDYYIFTTNVTLSPGEGGAKDKIFRTLKQFAESQGITGYDVWDYDKIRILIDNNAEVRRTYAAWLTPGDVLSELCSYLKTVRPDYYKLTSKFLQKELLADQYAKLEQAGHSADEAIPLSQVFVDLPATKEPYVDALDEFAEDLEHLDYVKLIVRDASEICRGAPIHPTEVGGDGEQRSGKAGRHVLIGGPGQGKTTLGQYICQIFRASLLCDVESGLLDTEALQILSSLQDQFSTGVMPEPGARRLPFRVVLSEFASSLAASEAPTLMEYLTRHFNRKANSELTTQDFEALLVAYPIVLILDGLDEVPASTNRDELLSAVREFWVDVASSKIDALVVATSRPQGYNEDFSPKLYEHRWLVPLSSERALDYGTKLANVRFRNDANRVDKVVGRLQRAVRTASTARIMRSPLQVTILTLLVDRMGQPPQERWALFREYYNLIYQRETERDIPAATVLREHRADIDAVHQRVGLLLQVESERSGGTDAKLSDDQFSQVVEEYLLEEEHSGDSLATLKKAIIEGAANRLVFLVGLEAGQIGFEIRSLQEFMAAEGLMDAEDPTVRERLRVIAGNSNWRNVFLFAAGKCFVERRHLRDTIQGICADLNDDPDDQLSQAILAGSELALDILEDGSVSRQPAKNRALTRLAIRLLTTPDDYYSRHLADIWQDQTNDIFLEGLKAGIDDQELPVQAASWRCLVYVAERAGEGSPFEQLINDRLNEGSFSQNVYRAIAVTGYRRSDVVMRWLAKTIPARSPRLSSIVFRGDRRDITGSVSEHWETQYPDWLHSLRNLLNSLRNTQGHELTVNLNVTDDASFCRLMIEGINRRRPNEIRTHPLQDIPEDHWLWPPVKAYFRFSAAPSKESLAQALESLAGIEDKVGESDRKFLASLSPWPLAETTLLAGADNCSASTLARLAAEGELGDEGTWNAAERRWVTEGVNLVGLQYITPGKPAIESHDWFPIRCVTAVEAVAPDRQFACLAEAIIRSESQPYRLFLAELLRICVINHEGNYPLPEVAVKALPAIFEHSWRFGAQVLDSAPPIDDVSSDLASALARPDEVALLSYYPLSPNKNLSATAINAYRKYPEMTGLLVPIAVQLLRRRARDDLVASNQAILASVFNTELPANETDLRIARCVIAIRTLPWSDRLRAEIAELIVGKSSALSIFVDAIRARNDAIADETDSLLELLAITRTLHRPAFPVQTALRGIMRRRRSRLSDLRVWRALKFPPELAEILGD